MAAEGHDNSFGDGTGKPHNAFRIITFTIAYLPTAPWGSALVSAGQKVDELGGERHRGVRMNPVARLRNGDQAHVREQPVHALVVLRPDVG